MRPIGFFAGRAPANRATPAFAKAPAETTEPPNYRATEPPSHRITDRAYTRRQGHASSPRTVSTAGLDRARARTASVAGAGSRVRVARCRRLFPDRTDER